MTAHPSSRDLDRRVRPRRPSGPGRGAHGRRRAAPATPETGRRPALVARLQRAAAAVRTIRAAVVEAPALAGLLTVWLAVMPPAAWAVAAG